MSKKGDLEFSLHASGHVVCGVDEVGRGCLAGPVCAGAVIFDIPKLLSLPMDDLNLIRDSKTLTKVQRQKIIPVILSCAVSSAVAFAGASEIDQVNILQATFLAMKRAILKLSLAPTYVLVDGNQMVPGIKQVQRAIIGGDKEIYAIAAASIIAKEARDFYMSELEKSHPGYGFERHVGYGTKNHLEAMKNFGITSEHRKSFKPVALLCTEQRP